MSYLLKQGQTASPILFLMVDSADHVTGKTSLSPTVTLSKNGGAFAVCAGAVTEIANGWYKVAGNATDAGTLGPLVLHATSAGADPTDAVFDVVGFDPNDTTTLAALSASLDNVFDSLETSINAVPAATVAALNGTGARTVTITVNDGTDPLESARVRLTKGADTYVSATNALGVVAFNLDDGTWVVSISLTGYSFAGASLVVDGTETSTYSMSGSAITPSDPGATTGYLTCYDEFGAAEAGVTVTARLKSAPASVTGGAFDTALRSETSDVNGLVQFTNLFKGVTYVLARGNSGGTEVRIPTTTGTTYALPSVVGEP